MAERAGVRHRQRKTAKDHQARGGDPSADQQIHQCRFAGDQDADGHDEGSRTERRRRRIPNNAVPSTQARPGGQAGDQELLVRSLRPSIEGVNKVVRTSRQMLTEIGREPTPEEVANKLSMPLEKVR
jgi:hypothetical protein